MPFGVLWNSTGQPAASVPAGFAPHGLPLAVQLVGRPHGEGTLLALAAGDRGCAVVGTSPSRARSIASVRRRMAGCRICSGELELKVQGNGAAVDGRGAVAVRARRRPPRRPARAASSAGPSSSRSCRTGDELHDLYRDMRDDDYLAEEAGRRATANRLLDLIGAHVPERAPARRRLRPRPAARRGAQARLRDGRAGAVPRGRAARALARASTCASCRWRPSARARNGDSPGELRRRSCSPTCSSTSTIRSPRSTSCARAAAARRRAVRRHARPVVGRPPSSPARAGGATCPRTPSCCRGGRCAS